MPSAYNLKPLTYAKREELIEQGLLYSDTPNIEQNPFPVGKTPFTQGSWAAWSSIIGNSVLHNAATPLLMIMFTAIQEMPLNHSLFLVAGTEILAASINFWVNYYKNIERLTGEFKLELETRYGDPKEPSTLYFYYVSDNKRQRILHYNILIEDKKENLIEIGILDDLDEDLQQKLGEGRFRELTKQDSKALKTTIAKHYPHHKPALQADEDVTPGQHQDTWFFIKCAVSEIPTAAAGVILGYTATQGQAESSRVGAAILFALLNYIKNILIDLPIVANAYENNSEHGKMGPIIDQPFTWLVLNTFVFWLLKNVAPIGLALLTAYGVWSAKSIPAPLNTILAVMLIPFVASTFLIFTMYALQKLNLSYGSKNIPQSLWKNFTFNAIGEYFFSRNKYTIFSKNQWRKLFSISAVKRQLSLHNSLALEVKSWNDLIYALPGELLGWRAFTISGFLNMRCSAYAVATLLAVASALGSIGLIYQPTSEIAADFFEFINQDKASNAAQLFTYALLLTEVFLAIMNARSQWSNFHECVKLRQTELGINTKRSAMMHAPLTMYFAHRKDRELTGPFSSSTIQDFTSQNMTEADFRKNPIIIENNNALSLILPHSILYGSTSPELQALVPTPFGSPERNSLS